MGQKISRIRQQEVMALIKELRTLRHARYDAMNLNELDKIEDLSDRIECLGQDLELRVSNWLYLPDFDLE